MKKREILYCLYVLSISLVNLLANKELLNWRFICLDCGLLLSWPMLIIVDLLYNDGIRESEIDSLFKWSFIISVFVSLLFYVVSLSPFNWGEAYNNSDYANIINYSLDSTFKGYWYIILISNLCLAFYGYLKFKLLKFLGEGGSSLVTQLLDNLTFGLFVSHSLFGWDLKQIIGCSLVGALIESLGSIILSIIKKIRSLNVE